MPFTIGNLIQNLLMDNPTYERSVFSRSDLHALVAILRQVPARWTPGIVAAEMKKISAVKWRKYARTRLYLEQEIPTLTGLLRATPTNFRTIVMSSQLGDMILRHTFQWKSDTGSLGDLAGAFVRERVNWPLWPVALRACIGLPHGAEYLAPGHHSGLGYSLANTGQGKDDHSLMAVFNQTILNYQGALLSAPMDQVYEYSYDKVNWLPIPNSTFSIVREVTGLAGGRVQVSITKTNLTNPRDRFVVKKIF